MMKETGNGRLVLTKLSKRVRQTEDELAVVGERRMKKPAME